MTSDEIRRSASYKALASCLLRHILKQRDATLDRIRAKGGKWDPDLSLELDRADHALTEIGAYDTK